MFNQWPMLLAAACIVVIILFVFRLSRWFTRSLKVQGLETREKYTESQNTFLPFKAQLLFSMILLWGIILLSPLLVIFRDSLLTENASKIYITIFVGLLMMSIALYRSWMKNDLEWQKDPKDELE